MDDRIVYGLDLSLTATGFAAANVAGQIEILETIGFKKLADEARLAAIVDAVLSRIKTPRMVAIEGLAINSRTGMSVERAALHYMVRVALWEAHVPFVIVPPQNLKKFVTGKGNSEKCIVVREVSKRWGIEAKDDNQADAAVLAHVGMAWARWTPLDSLIQAQREVIASLAKTQTQAAAA